MILEMGESRGPVGQRTPGAVRDSASKIRRGEFEEDRHLEAHAYTGAKHKPVSVYQELHLQARTYIRELQCLRLETRWGG